MFGYLRVCRSNNPFGCTDADQRRAAHWIMQAAFHGLDNWVRNGVAPPAGPLLDVISSSPVVLDRDTYGNALGGVRSPHVDVPVATLDSVDSGSSFPSVGSSAGPFR